MRADTLCSSSSGYFFAAKRSPSTYCVGVPIAAAATTAAAADELTTTVRNSGVQQVPWNERSATSFVTGYTSLDSLDFQRWVPWLCVGEHHMLFTMQLVHCGLIRPSKKCRAVLSAHLLAKETFFFKAAFFTVLLAYFYNRAMAKNGSSRCFLAKNGCTLKIIAAGSVVGRIFLANTHYLPFLAKSDRVLPVIATLLSFHPFLAILCSFPVGYSTTRTDQHGPKFRPGDVRLTKIYIYLCKQLWK